MYGISIVGQNFGIGCCVTASILFDKNPCLNPVRVNDSLMTCTSPAVCGYASFIPVVTLNETNLKNTIPFNYYPPSITSVSPATGYGNVQLNVFGSEFGESSSPVQINFQSTSNPSTSTACNSPVWQSSTRLFCTTPIMSPGNYTVQVSVFGQSSSQTIILVIVAAPPPVAHDVNAFGVQATVQKSILISLNVSSSLSLINYYVQTMPTNGTLYQFSSGVVGSEIQQGGTPLISSSLFYLPNQYFSGSDHFSYYANDGSRSNDANVNISIAFTNQAPSFTSSSFTLALNESFSSYEIDILSLVFDPDEFSNYTYQFLSLPTRGIWKLNGNPTFVTNSTVLTLGKSNRFQLSLDQKGGINPYFTTTGRLYDSYGLMSSNDLEITGFITCNSTNALNTWGTGPICVPCPLGAIWYLKLYNLSSPTGEFPITNDYGYYAVDTTLNNQTTVIFIKCVPPEACPARKYKYGTQTCAEGYSGIRCGTCEQKYYSYGNVCNKCPELNISPIVLGLIAFAILVIVMYVAYKMSKMDVGFIGVVYTYFQALSAFYRLNLSWPPLVLSFLGYLSIFSLNIDIVSPECFQATSPGQSFQFKFFVTLAIPVCLVITGVVLYSVYYVPSKLYLLIFGRGSPKEGQRSPTVISQLLSTTLLAMKFLFLTLATTILSIFNCSYDGASGTYYFEPAPSRICYIQSWWWDLLPYSIATLIIYIFGTILVSTLVETKAGKVRAAMKKASEDGKLKNVYVTKKEWLLVDMTQTDFPVYRPEYLYWDAIIMVRKLLLSIVMNFMTHTPQTQCILLIMIFLISLVIQNQHQPFYKSNINKLEETTLISSSMVLLVGLIASTKETTDPIFVFVLGILLIVFICGSGVVMCWKILQHWYAAGLEAKLMMQKKLKKSFGSLNNMAKKSMGSLNNLAKRSMGSLNDIANAVRRDSNDLPKQDIVVAAKRPPEVPVRKNRDSLDPSKLEDAKRAPPVPVRKNRDSLDPRKLEDIRRSPAVPVKKTGKLSRD